MRRLTPHSLFAFISVLLMSVLCMGCPPISPIIVTPPALPLDTGVVAALAFNPPEGTYTSARNIAISCGTSGAEIRYTTDGTQPTNASTLYAGGVNISSTTTLRAIAMKTGLMSCFGRADFTITGKVQTPGITPASASFSAPVEVTITCGTVNADIHYTLDGSYPQLTSPVYGGPFTISETSSVVAVARKSGWDDSDMTFSTIVINIPSDTAVPPTISPEGGVYYADQSVTLAQPDAEYIYYTTDGGDPAVSGIAYSGTPITVNATGTRIRAYAVDTGKTNQNSAEVSATYRLKAATPVPSPGPAAGAIVQGAVITLSSSTPGADFQYSYSGGDPTTLYTGYITLVYPHLRAIAIKTGYEDSDLLVAEYAMRTLFSYTDGNGHMYQLMYNGADVDITGMFEHASETMAFSVSSLSASPHTFYASGDHVYQLVPAGPDIDLTAGFESFASGSVIFLANISVNASVYRTGDKLYAYDPAGVDADITPPYFTSSSEFLINIFTNGAGQVYSYSLTSPTDYTSLFDYVTSASHFSLVDMDQAGTYYGYITGTDRWILSPSTDLSFDSSEYEHFTVESVIFFTADLP